MKEKTIFLLGFTLFCCFLLLILVRHLTRYARFVLMLKQHNQVCSKGGIHKIFGCINCGKQLYPLDERYSCGSCLDWDLCGKCYRKVSHPHKLFHDILQPCVETTKIEQSTSVSEALEACFISFGPRPCLGRRRTLSNRKFSDEYHWISYSEVFDVVSKLCSGIETSLETSQKTTISQGGIIGIYGASSVEWLISYYAAILRGWIIIPLHSSLEKSMLYETIQKVASNLKVIFVSKHLLPVLQEAISKFDNDFLLVSYEDSIEPYTFTLSRYSSSSPEASSPSNKQPLVLQWNDVISLGNTTKRKKGEMNIKSTDSERIVLLLPTSGTSSVKPKLTIVTDGMLKNQLSVTKSSEVIVMLSYEPLRQTLDILAKGGRIGLFSGSLDRILEDAQSLRPTVFGAVPTFYNGLFSQFNQEFLKLQECNQQQLSLKRLQNKLIKQWKKRHLFGNRLNLVITGGAPISQEVLTWMSNVFGCCVVDGYGSSECGGLVGNGSVNSGVSIQLLDCPELGFLTSDNPPRGEIIAHTGRITPGYFNDQEATENAFITINNKRFFRTGDIGELSPGNKIAIIGRRSNIVKLAQGVFVSPETLETFFSTKCSELVKQIFIHGSGLMSQVIAIVVPTEFLLQKSKLTDDPAENLLVKAFIKEGEKAGKSSFEVPHIIKIELESFTQANGLLNAGNKLARQAIQTRYNSFFSLFETQKRSSIGSGNSEVVSNSISKTHPHQNGICKGLLSLVCSNLGIPENSIDPSMGIFSLGADSMRLALLVSQIQHHFGVSVPLPLLVKLPSLFDLQSLVFGENVSKLIANQSDFFIQEVQEVWNVLSKLSFSPQNKLGSHVVLLTGASGFLGSFLLESLLSQAGVSQIICIVRSQDDKEAENRIKQGLQFFKCSISNINKLVSLSGDISRIKFGLESHTYLRLVKDVSIIIHNASVVSSALNYQGHKETNVIGTKHILEFASESRCSLLSYVSTAGILAASNTIQSENGEPSPKSLSMLGGYAQSKWVAEQLIIKSGNDGLPFLIFRPSTIIGHSRTGASNPKDFFNSLLCGLIQDKIICLEERSPLPKFFNIVPVDFVSKVIVSATLRHELFEHQAKIFNMIGQEIKMNEIIALIKSCGFDMKEVTTEKFQEHISNISQKHPLFPFKETLIANSLSTTTDFNTQPNSHNSDLQLLLQKIQLQNAKDITPEEMQILLMFFKEHSMI